MYKLSGITCERCGAYVTSLGASHVGNPAGQWECRYCGWIKQR